MRRFLTLSALGIVGTLVVGCSGTFGGTNRFVLDIVTSTPHAPLAFGSLRIAEGANKLDSTGTYHIGAFGEDDRKTLEASFRDTLTRLNDSGFRTDERPLTVHVLLRRYFVAHSNNDGAILAVVAFAVSDATGALVHADQFYASAQADDVAGLATVGKVSDMINEAITERIVKQSLGLAERPTRQAVPAVDHTYDSIDAAAQPLPRTLISLFGLPTLSANRVDWTSVDPKDEVDWSAHLVDSN